MRDSSDGRVQALVDTAARSLAVEIIWDHGIMCLKRVNYYSVLFGVESRKFVGGGKIDRFF